MNSQNGMPPTVFLGFLTIGGFIILCFTYPIAAIIILLIMILFSM